MRHLPKLLLPTLTFCATPAAAGPSFMIDDTWTLSASGQLRPRVLLHSGRDFLPESELEEVVTQRAALGLQLAQARGPVLTLRIQDSRIWGEEANSLNDYSANGLDLREAHVQFPIVDDLSFKIGRQIFSFDTERLIGGVEWRQSGRSFDGGRLSYSREKWDIDVAYAKVREAGTHPDGNVPEDRNGDIDLGIVHATFKPIKQLTVAPIYIINHNDAIDETGDEDSRHTFGVTLNSNPVTGLALLAEGFYQAGKLRNQSVSAYLATAHLGYTFDVPLSPLVRGWFEIVSGDGTPQGSFDTLYATNHKFYGEADFFLNLPTHTANLGLMDLGGRIGFKPHDKLGFHVDAHHFRSVESDIEGNNTFGTELDFKLVFSARDDLQLRGLYAIFLASSTMGTIRELERAPADEHFSYVTLDYQF